MRPLAASAVTAAWWATPHGCTGPGQASSSLPTRLLMRVRSGAANAAVTATAARRRAPKRAVHCAQSGGARAAPAALRTPPQAAWASAVAMVPVSRSGAAYFRAHKRCVRRSLAEGLKRELDAYCRGTRTLVPEARTLVPTSAAPMPRAEARTAHSAMRAASSTSGRSAGRGNRGYEYSRRFDADSDLHLSDDDDGITPTMADA